VKVFTDVADIVAGDGAFTFGVFEWMDGLSLVGIEAYVTTVSSAGIVQCQIHNVTDGVDILSTRVQVDAGEFSSKDAATQPVINAANAVATWGEQWRIDVDAAGTGATGLGIGFLLE
jgi:hypothetical protein